MCGGVRLGVDRLEGFGFRPLVGKRVGLLTHRGGVNGEGVPTWRVLWRAASVNLVALYSPEHGLESVVGAGVGVNSGRHGGTDLPLYSLYGQTRSPTEAMLEGVEVVVVDLQSVGVRSYTYISCMKLMMEACFRRNIEVVVLDRPNPLGAWRVDGPVLEEGLQSYVGAFPVPYLHGMTLGELAYMAKETQGWLNLSERERKRGRLTLVPMGGYTRTMTWDKTGLKWVGTSPHIPTVAAALGYAMSGLGTQLGSFKHGIGSPWPFRLLSHRLLSAQDLKRRLDSLNLPGLSFKVRSWSRGGREKEGVYVRVEDWESVSPTLLSFNLMLLTCQVEGNVFAQAKANKRRSFNIHTGSKKWWQALVLQGAQAPLKSFWQNFKKENATFQKQAKAYWLYP